MPAELQELLHRALSGLSHPPSGPFTIRPVGGGSINQAFQVSTKDNVTWFCKFDHKDDFPYLFVKEAKGLALKYAGMRPRKNSASGRIANVCPSDGRCRGAGGTQGIFRVPLTLACTDLDERQVLVLEWIRRASPDKRFWALFGEQLAAMHRVTAPPAGHIPTSTTSPSHNPTSLASSPSPTPNPPISSAPTSPPLFGLDHDNYMGALPQSNTSEASWPEFFINQRLEPQITLASKNGLLPNAARDQFQRLYRRLPAIFPPEPPALLHGDGVCQLRTLRKNALRRANV